MSEYCAVFTQGALFYKSDFDPCKLILAADVIFGLKLDSATKMVLATNAYTKEAARNICHKMEIPMEENETNYIWIRDIMLDDEFDDIKSRFSDGEIRLGSDIAGLACFYDLEAQFFYSHPDIDADTIDDCMMLCLNGPYVWEIASYDGPKTKETVVAALKDASKSLLKDDIDWEARLGILVGVFYD